MPITLENKTLRARVYCPICTHTVEADVTTIGGSLHRKVKAVEGQKCPRCSALLDAAYVLDTISLLQG